MLKVDVDGRHTELAQCVLETLRHPTRAAHVDILGDDRPTTAGLDDVFHGEGPVALGGDHVRPEGWMLCGRRPDLVEEQRFVLATHRVVQIDVELYLLLCGERADPAPKGSDADAASDPHLLTGTLAVIEQTKRNTHDGRCPRLEGVREVLGVIAQGLDREAKIAFLRGIADAEGVAFPLGAPTEVHENELPRDKRQGSGRGSKDDLGRVILDSRGASAHSNSSTNPISATCPSTLPSSFRFGSGALVTRTLWGKSSTTAATALQRCHRYMRSRPPKKRSSKGARVASTREHDNRTIAVVAKISPTYMVPGTPGGRSSTQRTTLVMARPTMTSPPTCCCTNLNTAPTCWVNPDGASVSRVLSACL